MADTPIDFWFTMGSTYSYLSVMRLKEVEKSTGLSFRWRPFHLLLILQGMNHVPFADKPAKLGTCVATSNVAQLCMGSQPCFRLHIPRSSQSWPISLRSWV